MKYLKHVILATIFITTNFINAQQMKVISGGEISFIPEIRGIVELRENKLIISSLNDQAGGDKINLKLEDEIMYVNGTRIKSLDSFEKNYEKTEIGTEVKLGIKRNGELMITSFTKQDPSSFKHKIMRLEGPSDGTKIDKVEMKNGKVYMDGKEVNIDSLKQEGVMIKTKSDDK